MKWNSFLLSLLLAVGVAIAHPSPGTAQTPAPAPVQAARESPEAHKLFVEGRDLHDDGKYADAEKKFREALSKYPKADQSDRTAYYLITTLEKLRRVLDARIEIDNFRKNYPGSRWRQDVEERSMALGHTATGGLFGGGLSIETPAWSPIDRELQEVVDATRSGVNANRIVTPPLPPTASWRAEVLRQIIALDPEKGIENAREFLKTDPSDPAIIANLGNIANSNSPQALPFLLTLVGNAAASPNTRTNAFFWATRRTDKEQLAKALMDLLAKKENESIVNVALFRMSITEHRAVLEQIASSSHPEKLTMLEKIYGGGSVQLRSDLLRAVSRIPDPKALAFIADAAQNDKDAAVRNVAVQALASRRDLNDVKTLENLLKSLPRTPSTTAPAPVPSAK